MTDDQIRARYAAISDRENNIINMVNNWNKNGQYQGKYPRIAEFGSDENIPRSPLAWPEITIV